MSGVVEDFFAACFAGDVEQMRALLRSDPSLAAARNKQGSTGLHAAHACSECVQLLLAAGANPNARDTEDNISPLHLAAADGNLDAMRALLDAGADVHGAGDLHNGDIIGWAAGDGSPRRHAAVALLIERGARHHIFSAIALGDANLVRAVVATNADALSRRQSKYEQSQSALHFALSSPNSHAPGAPHYDIASLLIELGADVEAQDDLGRTPLQVAMMQGDLTAMRLLIRAGAALPKFENIPDVHKRIAILQSSMSKQATPMMCVTDVNTAVTWYARFGFTLNARVPEHGDMHWASMTMGKAEIMLQSLGSRPSNQIALWFHTDRIDELYELCKVRQLTAARDALDDASTQQLDVRFYEDLYSPHYGGRQFSLRDVSGFEIVFYAP